MQKKFFKNKIIFYFIISYIAIAFLSLFGSKLNYKYGFISNSISRKNILSSEYKWGSINSENCHINTYKKSFNEVIISCERNFVNSNKKILLVGDSHAWHYLPALKIISENNKINTKVTTFGSCLFLPGMSNFQTLDCQKYLSDSFDYIIDIYLNGGIVIVSSGWTGYIKDNLKGDLFNQINSFSKLSEVRNKFKNKSNINISNKKQTGKLIILGPSPRVNIETIKCFYPGMRKTNYCLQAFDNVVEKNYANKLKEPLKNYFKSFGFQNVIYLNVYDKLCLKNNLKSNNDYCRAIDDNGNLLFTDSSHLSVQNALNIKSLLEKFID